MRILWVIMLALLPLVIVLQTAIEDVGNMPVLAILFILAQNWNTFRNKERREYKNAILPVSKYRLGRARIIIVLLLSLSVIIGYDLVARFADSGTITYVIPGEILIGIILIGFSIYFIMRDLLLAFLRRVGLTANRMILVLTVMAIGFNILGIVAFIQAKSSPDSMSWIGTGFEFLKNNNPFAGDYGSILFFVTSLVIAGLTVASYINRKYYLE
jgi:hypothetical protein